MSDGAPPPGKAYKPMMAKLEAKVFDREDWIYERKLLMDFAALYWLHRRHARS